jgi:hypothetical protein
LLLNRQRVDVCSQEERLALAVLEYSGEPVSADVRVNLKCVEIFEVLDDSGCCLLFAEGELGVRVEPFV